MTEAAQLVGPGTPNVYTMPPGVPFLQNLARGLRAALGDNLHTAMILLPTRRAVRELTDVFVKAAGGQATLLPIMRTLAERTALCAWRYGVSNPARHRRHTAPV